MTKGVGEQQAQCNGICNRQDISLYRSAGHQEHDSNNHSRIRQFHQDRESITVVVVHQSDEKQLLELQA